MHWRTYERLVIEHDRWVAMSIAGMAKRLGLNRQQLEDLDSDILP